MRLDVGQALAIEPMVNEGGAENEVREDCWTVVTRDGSLFFFQAEDGIRAAHVTGVQTCALPISARHSGVQLMWMLPASISRIARTAPATSEVKTPAARPYAVPLACAIAAAPAAVLTVTAGPNSSCWLSGEAGSTSATTVGATKLPSRSPPVRTRAPPSAAVKMARRTRSASAVLISVPIPVSGEDGSPVRMASTLGTRASRKSPLIAGWAMTRCTEMHTWPALT